MSTGKHFDLICVIVMILALTGTGILMGCSSGATVASGISMEYESTLFDDSIVHSIEIVMDDWEGFIDTCESEEYTVCNITIDGETYKNVGIRGKGNTSLTNVKSLGSERYSFKVEFDKYDDSMNYYGLDKMCLNNLIQDNTLMKDYLTYQLMEDFGVASPLCSYVYITVNGDDWGLYLATEAVEESFLERNYGTNYGNLYKPDSTSTTGGGKNGENNEQPDNSGVSDKTSMGNNDISNVSESGNGTAPDMQDHGSVPEMTKTESSEAPDMTRGGSGSIPEKPEGTTSESSEVPDMTKTESSEVPDMTRGGSGGIPEKPEGTTFGSGDTGGNGSVPENANGILNGNGMEQGFGNNAGNIGGGAGGMSSDAVKLKYIDDDADSYPEIFDNAKTDITEADKTTLINALKNLSEYSNISETVDIESVIRYFVINNFVCNDDSYTGSMIHNYYLYEKNGILSMIPWDYNLAFGGFQGNDATSLVNRSIDSPISSGTSDDRPMFGWILSDEEYTDQYHELFAEFIENYIDNDALLVKIEKTRELISEYVDRDPTKFCTTEEFNTAVDTLGEFIALRGQAIANQLNGNDEQVEASDISISDMGGMNAGKGAGIK